MFYQTDHLMSGPKEMGKAPSTTTKYSNQARNSFQPNKLPAIEMKSCTKKFQEK